ncbi:TPA: ATP-binding protein, partial [Enterococcus faecium]|nr:ATP-binding protein [Enterococcus faecium]
ILNLFGESAPNNNEEVLEGSIRRMNSKLNTSIEEALKAKRDLSIGYLVGNLDVLDNNTRSEYADQLESFKLFCEQLLRYNSIPKMKNLNVSISEIEKQKQNKELVESLNILKKNVDEVSQLVNYLDQAKYSYGQNSDWSKTIDETVSKLRSNISDGQSYMSNLSELRQLKEEYITQYYTIHEQSRLTATEDNKKQEILRSPQLNMLRRLQSSISLLPGEQLDNWQENLERTKACYQLKKTDLEMSPTCPHCNFLLSIDKRDSRNIVENSMDKLTDIYDNWLNILIDNLKQDSIQDGLTLLTNDEQRSIELLISSKELPLPLNQRFIDMIKNLFDGFEKVELSKEDIIQMLGNGSPMSIDELEGRIRELIATAVDGKDRDKVRIMYKG